PSRWVRAGRDSRDDGTGDPEASPPRMDKQRSRWVRPGEPSGATGVGAWAEAGTPSEGTADRQDQWPSRGFREVLHSTDVSLAGLTEPIVGVVAGCTRVHSRRRTPCIGASPVLESPEAGPR